MGEGTGTLARTPTPGPQSRKAFCCTTAWETIEKPAAPAGTVKDTCVPGLCVPRSWTSAEASALATTGVRHPGSVPGPAAAPTNSCGAAQLMGVATASEAGRHTLPSAVVVHTWVAE